jgi:hypothetical protein
MDGDLTKMKIDMAKLQSDVEYIKKGIDEVQNTVKLLEKKITVQAEEFDKKYVSRDKFSPVQSIVYGMVGAILLAFLYALTNFAIK